jgi:hypothetical protein
VLLRYLRPCVGICAPILVIHFLSRSVLRLPLNVRNWKLGEPMLYKWPMSSQEAHPRRDLYVDHLFSVLPSMKLVIVFVACLAILSSASPTQKRQSLAQVITRCTTPNTVALTFVCLTSLVVRLALTSRIRMTGLSFICTST